jgi:hypothetical protein
MIKRTTVGLLTLAAMLYSTVSLAQLKHLDLGVSAIERSEQPPGRGYHARARCDAPDNTEQSRDARAVHHGIVRRGDESVVHHVSPVAAPELDWTLATSALALLAGCVAIMRARRQTQKVTCE